MAIISKSALRSCQFGLKAVRMLTRASARCESWVGADSARASMRSARTLRFARPVFPANACVSFVKISTGARMNDFGFWAYYELCRDFCVGYELYCGFKLHLRPTC